MSVYNIRQHTSAYVSIRPHTSVYVNIRQHTSAIHGMHLCIWCGSCLTYTYTSLLHTFPIQRPHTLRSRVHAYICIYVHIYDACDVLLWVKHVCQPHNQPPPWGFKAPNVRLGGGGGGGGVDWREDGQRFVPQNLWLSLIIKWYNQMGWLSNHWYWNFSSLSDYQRTW